jgi:hypothetical protein
MWHEVISVWAFIWASFFINIVQFKPKIHRPVRHEKKLLGNIIKKKFNIKNKKKLIFFKIFLKYKNKKQDIYACPNVKPFKLAS